MPNWCYNRVELSHTDKKKVDKLEESLKNTEDSETFFNHLRKRPAKQKDNWYEWNISHWGCKWDASPNEYERDENNMTIYFDSAWSPPIKLYEYLHDKGWTVEAYYHEPGMAYCGSFIDGDEDFYEYGDILEDYDELQKIPEEIYEFANLEYEHESHMEYLKEEQENEK